MVGFSGDDRGVSEVLGAILVFGLVLAVLALVQMLAVPAANANVEANHYEQVQEDLGQLQGALSRTATTGAGESVRVNLGTQYPSRFVLVNPPPVSGTLRTEPARQLTLENVRALDGETIDYLNTTNGALSFDTHSLVYTPRYHQLEDPGSTVFETGVRYKRFNDGENVLERGVLVSGRTITIVAIDGNLSETAVTASTLSTVPLSTSAQAVAVRNQSGPIRLRIPTNLSQQSWENRVLDEELDRAGTNSQKFVKNVSCANASVNPTEPCDDHLIITLENETTYDLRMAKVGIGSEYTHEEEKYVTDVSGDNESIAENGSQKLIVEVRDRFNNPVSGVNLTANVTNNASYNDTVDVLSNTTDSDGRASFLYHAPEDVNTTLTRRINVSFAAGGGGAAMNRTVFSVHVMDSDGSVDIVDVICNHPQIDVDCDPDPGNGVPPDPGTP